MWFCSNPIFTLNKRKTKIQLILSKRTIEQTVERHPRHCNSIYIDDKQWPKAVWNKTSFDELKWNTVTLTGGRGTLPVNVLYCLKTSVGFGPRKKNPSKMPDSNIQCVVTSGTSLLSLPLFEPKKLLMVERIFYIETSRIVQWFVNQRNRLCIKNMSINRDYMLVRSTKQSTAHPLMLATIDRILFFF